VNWIAAFVLGLLVGAVLTRLRDRKAIRKVTRDLKTHTDALRKAANEIQEQPELGKGVDDGDQSRS
jgi:uncharacterized membrane-anchored protein YhcB (DUF1043 family)